jgi:hypothetical protein
MVSLTSREKEFKSESLCVNSERILHYFLRSFLICLRSIPQAVILNLVFCDETARAFRLEGHVCELQLVLNSLAELQVACREKTWCKFSSLIFVVLSFLHTPRFEIQIGFMTVLNRWTGIIHRRIAELRPSSALP